MAELNDKQRSFCDEYLIDLNATQAAIRAGYSEKTAYSIGQRLLKDVEVQNYISKRQKERSERTEITQDKVLKELAVIAFANTTDFARIVEKQTADENGKVIKYKTVDLTLTSELSEEQQRALAVVKEGKFGIEVKPHDKVRALELLGKHLGMWTDNVNVMGDMDLNIVVDYGATENED